MKRENVHNSAKIQQNGEFTKKFVSKYARNFMMSAKCQFLISLCLHQWTEFSRLLQHQKFFVMNKLSMKLLLVFAFHLSFFTLRAQTEKSVQLDEVTVESARMVEKSDRKIFFPTTQQLESSTSGFSLLSKLAMPFLRVDEVAQTITAPPTMGGVQVRINDVVATSNDLLSLDLSSVLRVEYIDHPGVRYGNDLGFVINIITRRATSGYVIGTRIAQSVTALMNSDAVYGKYNTRKSEWGIDYNLSYFDLKGTRNEDSADYLLTDGSTYRVHRRDLSHHTQQMGHKLQLHYSLRDSLRVFQLALRGSLSNLKKSRIHREISTPDSLYHAVINAPDQSASPALDLYYFRRLSPKQSLTLNAVGTYIGSDYDYSYNNYAYHADGSAYSLQSEALYEHQLRPFTLTVGAQWNQKYTDNRYSGATSAQTGIRRGEVNAFAQLQGELAKIQYTAEVGMNHQHYHQGNYQRNNPFLRSKLSLSYPLSDSWSLNYDFSLKPYLSILAATSDVSVMQNEREINLGNPDSRPCRQTEHTLSLDYQSPRLGNSFSAFFRDNHHAYMQKIYRNNDNQFVFTRANQGSIKFFYLSNYTNYVIIPKHLIASFSIMLSRMWNFGDNYTHCYTACNYQAMLQAYVGRFSFDAFFDNGYRFLEGESNGINGSDLTLSATYKHKAISLSLSCQGCFSPHALQNRTIILNQFVHKQFTSRSSDFGNLLKLTFTYRLSHGRKYDSPTKRINHSDSDSGILKN